ncbi:MAG: efflux RND transporter periplasmic adaptor subunit [Candidatus Wildermuthbacteria bacterium]|nr:efflux RND transporter periplasmic adaptor subunit [Candidatus Wildermuthbacteria bacterium]
MPSSPAKFLRSKNEGEDEAGPHRPLKLWLKRKRRQTRRGKLHRLASSARQGEPKESPEKHFFDIIKNWLRDLGNEIKFLKREEAMKFTPLRGFPEIEYMPNFFKKRKVLSVFLIIIAVIVGGYFGYRKIKGGPVALRYVTSQAQKGTIVVSVAGSGQVSAANQLDIKPKASGELAAIYATQGQEVKTGALLAKIDEADAERAVRDAETSLETAKLELDKLLEPVDELTLLQSENSLVQAKETKQKAEDNLKKTYDDGFNTVSDAFLDFPAVMAGLQDILFGNAFSVSQWNIDYYVDAVKAYDEKVVQYRNNAYDNYQTAKKAYDKNFNDYKSAGRLSAASVIESLINETYETAKNIADAVKSANNLVQFYRDKFTERNFKPNSLSGTHLSTLNTYTSAVNSNFSSLFSTRQSIKDSRDAITSAERSIGERELSLAKIKKGPDDLDIRAKKITIQQREDALTTAKQTLADHYVRAPFSGVVAKVNAKKGDSASVGTAIATLVTKQKIAEISLNEIDIAQIKASQKTTLTFDAVPDISIAGQVAEIETIGMVSQGVVTYIVKIAFDTEDERVKSGMSVSAAIITEAKPDVLLVPNSAVKSQGNAQYVEISDTTPPRRQIIEIGLANDEFTEIMSGLREGDIIVTSIINPSKAQTAETQGFQIPGMGGQQMRGLR